MKKIMLILLVVLLVFITGCDKKNISNDYSGKGILYCTREGNLEGGQVVFNYTINYKSGNIISLHSVEKVISSSAEILDQYEEAYKGIFKNYEGLKYYTNNITRTDDSVISDTYIEYGKIDVDKLLEIEGSDDNIFEGDQAKVEKWMELAKRFGTTCK